MEKILILGAGHAGCQLAFALRENGYSGQLTLLNGEDAAPYQRPPLSKKFLIEGRRDQLLLRADNAFADYDIQLLHDVALEIDRTRHNVKTQAGLGLHYSHLVLATGALNRGLSVPGGDDGVFYLKNVSEAEALRDALPRVERVAVIGAGFIGLEFAATAAALGKSVQVIDIAERLMARATSRIASAYFQRRHQEAGVKFWFGARIAKLVRRGDALVGVELYGGEVIDADLIVAGLGVTPNTQLAEAAGLMVNDGVVVDEHLGTTDPAISAIGDCARFSTPFAEDPVRLESVQNAHDQARCVARKLTSAALPYAAVPWFWSDQGADKLQIAGLSGAADQRIVRGLPEENKFSVFSFRDGSLFSVESINQPVDHMVARRILGASPKIDPVLIADTTIQIQTLMN